MHFIMILKVSAVMHLSCFNVVQLASVILMTCDSFHLQKDTLGVLCMCWKGNVHDYFNARNFLDFRADLMS